jgi:transcriptional regulator with XRE-family HTH domain
MFPVPKKTNHHYAQSARRASEIVLRNETGLLFQGANKTMNMPMLLKHWRKQKRFSLSDAAKYLAVSRTVLWAAEQGRSLPSTKYIARIEAGTGGDVTISDLYSSWVTAHKQVWKQETSIAKRASKSSINPHPER